MSKVNIPAGQSLREVAERLGVSVEELQKHAGVQDVAAPVAVEHAFEIPDGFLRAQDRNRRATMAAVPSTHVTEGLNSVVALELEYRRTRVAGGQGAVTPTDEEREALAEARRAFDRLEPASNALAIDLWAPLDKSRAIPVRAEAYAGAGAAHARRNIIYGDPPQTCRKAALSAAKSAIMADPKLPGAHLALGLALWVGEVAADSDAARAELERAVELGETDPEGWVWLSARLRVDGDLETARQASAISLELDPTGALALENAALLALDGIDLAAAEDLLRRSAAATPTFANPVARLVRLLDGGGRAAEADALFSELLHSIESDPYREHLAFLAARTL